MKNKLRKMTLAVMTVFTLCAMTGCSNNDKEEELATAAAEEFVKDYFTVEGNENSTLESMFVEERSGFTSARLKWLEVDKIQETFGELPVVDAEKIKIEEITPAIVDLSYYKDYATGTTSNGFKGDLPIWDANGKPAGNGNTFYGYEIESVVSATNLILKGFGEWHDRDVLPLDVAKDAEGWYRAYDVTLRWSYTNTEMNQSGDDCLMVNRLTVRVVYANNIWYAYNFSSPEDGKYCTAVI